MKRSYEETRAMIDDVETFVRTKFSIGFNQFMDERFDFLAFQEGLYASVVKPDKDAN